MNDTELILVSWLIMQSICIQILYTSSERILRNLAGAIIIRAALLSATLLYSVVYTYHYVVVNKVELQLSTSRTN